MLENSHLSKRVIKITDKQVLELIGTPDPKAADIKETRQAMEQAEKIHLEKMQVQNLFSSDLNNFLTNSSAITISFERDETLEPMTIRVTHTKMDQVEVKAKTQPKNPQEKPKNIIKYKRVPLYTTHIINDEDMERLDEDKTPIFNKKLEAVLKRASADEPYERKASTLDSDRMLVSLHPSVDKNSASMEILEDFLREKYEFEMRKYEMNMQDRRTLSSNTDPVARFAVGTRRTAVGVNNRI